MSRPRSSADAIPLSPEACSNRQIFYMDEIERAVLAGLQQHLKAPHLLKEFAKTYQEERQQLASEKTRRRSQVESQLAQLERVREFRWKLPARS